MKCGKNIVAACWAISEFLLTHLLANYSIRGWMYAGRGFN
jgi:hypothetical protein